MPRHPNRRCLKGVTKIIYRCSIHHWSSQENNSKLFSSDVSTVPLPTSSHLQAPGQPPAKTSHFQPCIALQTNISGDRLKCDWTFSNSAHICFSMHSEFIFLNPYLHNAMLYHGIKSRPEKLPIHVSTHIHCSILGNIPCAYSKEIWPPIIPVVDCKKDTVIPWLHPGIHPVVRPQLDEPKGWIQ